MSDPRPDSITELLLAARHGDDSARDALWRSVYRELKTLAKRQVAFERGPVTLQATTLVHELFLRLERASGDGPQSRHEFFAAAALAMRHIRVDYARVQRSQKRGGDHKRQPMAEEAAVFDQDPTEVLAIDEALDRLAAMDPRKAQVVNLRYFAGLSVDETAEVLGISARTVDNEWRLARVWLYGALNDGS